MFSFFVLVLVADVGDHDDDRFDDDGDDDDDDVDDDDDDIGDDDDEDGAIAGSGKTSCSECCVGLSLRILSASAVGRGLLLHLLFASFAQADAQTVFPCLCASVREGGVAKTSI